MNETLSLVDVAMSQIIYSTILIMLILDGRKNTKLDGWNIVHVHKLEGLGATINVLLWNFCL